MFLKEKKEIQSQYLQRLVIIDCYLPTSVPDASQLRLLLINDGQDMEKLGLQEMLNKSVAAGKITSLLFPVAIYAGERLMEYGTASELDYLGRGYKAKAYTDFILDELIPFLLSVYNIPSFKERAIAGFSLGGLSAMDIAWANPKIFTIAGVFSGSLWWRRKSLDDGYNEDTDRIMHSIVRNGDFVPGQRFYFQTGGLDETMDRNKNGIIDSIDDTLGLIDELERKGYLPEKDIRYLQIDDGTHDVETWARAMPDFLEWGWGANLNVQKKTKKRSRM